MAIIDGGLVSIPAHVENANNVKELILVELLQSNKISEETFNEYFENWNVIVIKNGWFKKWSNLFKKDPEQYCYRFVKF